MTGATGNEVLVDTASGPLTARVGTAARGILKQGDDAMVFIRPESFRIANGAGAGAGKERDGLG